jgi:tetratricopeptide (TPR) repeat protein
MYLFQAELAEAEQTGAKNVEALQALLEKKRSVDTDSSNVIASGATADCVAVNAGKTRRRMSSLESFSLGLLGGLGVLFIAWMMQHSSTVPSISSNTHAEVPFILPLNLDVGGDLVPNITDRAQGMRNEGHIRLQLSNCAEAAWWFSSARQLLSHKGNVSDIFQNHIVGEQGFALVCAGHFEEGVKFLEEHLTVIGLNPGAAHLLNALGYAHFFMKDMTKALVYFELSLRADELNPVPWNNFAGVKIMEGDLKGAEDALVRAHNNVEIYPLHQEHHIGMIRYNLQVLREKSEGKAQHAPWMDLWNGYVY